MSSCASHGELTFSDWAGEVPFYLTEYLCLYSFVSYVTLQRSYIAQEKPIG